MSDLDRTTTLRWIGVVAALACAAIYGLIGLGVLSVGESTTEATTDLLGFGLLMAGFSAVVALAVARLHARLWLAIVAGLQLVPLLGYVAAAGLREPPFELWGLLIKVGQAVVFVVATVLALAATTREPASATSMKGHAA